MAISATKWLITCLHYNEHWEALLSKAVKPYTDVVLQTGVAEAFFFERSTERGPHLRLCFKSTEFLLENMLKPNLVEHFQQYFEAKPSFLEAPKYPASFPEKLKWHPNNSVQFEGVQSNFLPQLGCVASNILEQQYQASSNMVLNTLKDRGGNWTEAEKMSTAIKLHLGMFYAFGMNLKAASNFAAWAYENWREGARSKETGFEVNSFRNAFQSNFSIQRKDLLSYFSAIWELLKNYRNFGEQAYVDWIHANTSTNLELDLALDAGKLTSLQANFEPTQPAWTFYADFIQKTNNRLGIAGKNEGYLYFSMAQCLRLLSQNNLRFSTTEFPKINAA